MEHEEFLLLPLNQLIEICSSDELNVRSEEQVYQATMSWVKFNIAERRQHLPLVRLFFFYFKANLEIIRLFSRSFNTSGCPCSPPSSWWGP